MQFVRFVGCEFRLVRKLSINPNVDLASELVALLVSSNLDPARMWNGGQNDRRSIIRLMCLQPGQHDGDSPSVLPASANRRRLKVQGVTELAELGDGFLREISIDRAVIEGSRILTNERVEIDNIDTGARFATYVNEAPPGSGMIGLNGAAARMAWRQNHHCCICVLRSGGSIVANHASCWSTEKTGFCQARSWSANLSIVSFSGQQGRLITVRS